MGAPETMNVEVIYALPEEQVLRAVSLPAGSTAAAALAASGLFEAFPQLRSQVLKLAVFGRMTHLDQCLRDGDRLEVLRELQADPKLSRQAKVNAARKAQRRVSG